MVISEKQRSAKKPAKQGVAEGAPKPIKIGASTPYDFDSKNLTAYGGLLPVATMLEKLKFRQLVEETLTVKRETRAMPWYQFVAIPAASAPRTESVSLESLSSRARCAPGSPAYE